MYVDVAVLDISLHLAKHSHPNYPIPASTPPSAGHFRHEQVLCGSVSQVDYWNVYKDSY